MPKKYRDADRSVDQSFLLPPSLREWLPEGHLAYFVLDVVDELDLSAIEGRIQAKDPRGERPYSPRMMVTLLFYAYTKGVFSSRRIASRCSEDIGFRVVANNQQPHFTTIADFRKEYLGELSDLFAPVLHLGVAGGVVKGSDLYQDGSKFQANASKHKAMSYDRMKQTEKKLKEEIDDLFAQAEAADAAEDAELGVGVDYSDGIAEELKRRDTRLAWIRRARAELEEEARKARARTLRKSAKAQRQKSMSETKPVEAKRQRTRATQSDAQADLLDPEPDPEPEDPANRLPMHQVPAEPDGLPKGRAQRNFTDPESRIMKNGQGAYVQGYNAQIVVDDGQFIVAHGLSNQAPDQEHLEPLLERSIRNLGSPPDTYTADAGYYSERNATLCRTKGCRPYLSVKRERRQWPLPEPVQGAPPPNATAKERMAWELRTTEGTEQMRRRKFKVEPVFGTIKEAMGFRRFLLRGLHKVRQEWALVCLAFNIKKLHLARS